MLDFKNIQAIRVKNNLSQNKIATLLNISRSSYAMWETNNEIFPIKRLLEFCDYFSTSLDFALGLIDDDKIINNKYDLNKYMVRLKEFRKENNLTQEKLALFLNTTKGVVCSYEKGRYIIATPFLYMICKKYDVSADYLLGRTDNPKYLKIKN